MLYILYSCASVFTDLLNIGNVDSGRKIYPCASFQNEVGYYFTVYRVVCVFFVFICRCLNCGSLIFILTHGV